MKINTNNKRIATLIALIIAGETVFFFPFVLARIFRPTLLAVYDISNTELGSYFSVYGVVAMLSYFFGGPLADKFSARYLISWALFLTAIGGFVLWVVPIKSTLFLLYAFWGLTTILLFWAALIRATREWGNISMQGRAFGWLDGGRGAVAAILGTLTLFVFSDFNPDNLHFANIQDERIRVFKNVILFTTMFTLFSGVLVWWFVPNNKETRLTERVQLSQMFVLLKLPSVWLISVIIICAYVGYKITDDFSLYANQVLGFNEFKSAVFGTASLWMRAVIAILAGYLADKVSASKILSLGFVITFLGALLVASGLIETALVFVIINLAFVMIGVYGVRALYFTLIQEANLPIYYTGTVVGIVSVLGFTPDVFMSPWMGYLLDINPGAIGHRYVFFVLAMFTLFGFFASKLFIRHNKSKFNLSVLNKLSSINNSSK